MSTTYAQRQTIAQKKDAPTAASVLDNSSQSESLQRKANMANNAAQRAEAPRTNNTGMPDNLKAGIESLSGFSMDDVRVHYNSSKPATVQALAYTQGTDIHVAPGQEKCLPHEAWHVAQQMAGRVSPTTNINGMPVNDNAGLEHEADVMGEKAVMQRMGAVSECFFPVNNLYSIQRCVVQRTPEENSVFDVELIRNFLNDQFGIDVADGDAERVQTLFEDIRQVDLQFLATTAISCQEDDALGTTAISDKEDDSLGTTAISGKENSKEKVKENRKLLYKKWIEDKIIYLSKMKESVEIRISNLKGPYEIALNQVSRSSVAYNKVSSEYKRRRKEKILEKNKRECEKIRDKIISSENYLEQLNAQIQILKKELESGYEFNQNVLLTSVKNGCVDFYMSIVGPSFGTYKDIVKKGDKLMGVGGRLQVGAATPVRQFSWYLKYLIDKGSKDSVNNPPIIRNFQMSQDDFLRWQLDAKIEEGENNVDNPINVDVKCSNQSGVKPESAILNQCGFSSSDLKSYVDMSVLPENCSLFKNGGKIKSIDKLKKKIGYGRWKNGKFIPSDVHLLDDSHTAFFSIEKGAGLYSAKEVNEQYEKTKDLMDYMEKRFGGGNEKACKDDIEKDEKIKKIIILNNCTPSAYSQKERKKIIAEREYGMDYLKNADYQFLLNLMKNDLEQLIESNPDKVDKKNYEENKNKFDDLIKTKKNLTIELQNVKKKILLEKLSKEQEELKKQENELNAEKNVIIGEIIKIQGELDNYENSAKYKNWEKNKDLLIELNHNSGVRFEIDILKSLLNKEKIMIRSFVNGEIGEMIESCDNKDSAKVHLISLCFKMLRIIANKKNGSGCNNVNNRNKSMCENREKRLFANRIDGRYFDQLNPKKDEINGEFVPYDKYASWHRFVPKGKSPVDLIPFIGGASGTTRDISKYLLSNVNSFNNEMDYYKFQLLNASFMSAYGYHSFFEAIYRGAFAWINYGKKDDNTISYFVINEVNKIKKWDRKKDDDEKIRKIKDYIVKKIMKGNMVKKAMTPKGSPSGRKRLNKKKNNRNRFRKKKK